VVVDSHFIAKTFGCRLRQEKITPQAADLMTHFQDDFIRERQRSQDCGEPAFLVARLSYDEAICSILPRNIVHTHIFRVEDWN
jgi:hypothetical protein